MLPFLTDTVTTRTLKEIVSSQNMSEHVNPLQNEMSVRRVHIPIVCDILYGVGTDRASLRLACCTLSSVRGTFAMYADSFLSTGLNLSNPLSTCVLYLLWVTQMLLFSLSASQ